HVHMLDLNCSRVKRWSLPHPSAMKGRPIHPRLESTGLSGPSTVNALIARSSSLKIYSSTTGNAALYTYDDTFKKTRIFYMSDIIIAINLIF
ncbi:MAG TPA: hypothetical protein VFK47_06310, partial [Ktedonobacteraceae bacterium]|nr:hypothetical protein [Ktedonobacteraceae bacterium]